MYGGACGTVDADLVGYFTSTCQSNPYAGRASTYTRMSTGGTTAQDTILSPCTSLGALDSPSNWSPGDCPRTAPCVPFNVQPSVGQNASQCYYPGDRAGYTAGPAFPFIPFDVDASDVQALADAFCNQVVPSLPDTASMCKGELLLRGDHPKNRHPGSELVVDYSTVTTYQYVGSIYNVSRVGQVEGGQCHLLPLCVDVCVFLVHVSLLSRNVSSINPLPVVTYFLFFHLHTNLQNRPRPSTRCPVAEISMLRRRPLMRTQCSHR